MSVIDPIQAELFSNRFRAIATEMGELLRRTALSTNIRERLDFSCAILDSKANLIVNAPHVPVHLGAMALCVESVSKVIDWKPGDTAITNHPGFGGSHLPDITLVTPVFQKAELLGFVASRAHHAEIGGTRPGSMPPDATSLEDEGVVFEPQLLVRDGAYQWDEIEHALRSAKHPSRAPQENVADLRAALAANNLGAKKFLHLAEEHGDQVVRKQMEDLQRISELEILKAIRPFEDKEVAATESLDDGSIIQVAIRFESESGVIDFSGTSPTHRNNLNAPPAIAHAAIIYALRVLTHQSAPNMPLNSGLLRPFEIRLPKGSMLNPEFSDSFSPAVVGGNVETSQRVVDTLLKALGLAACSQGTMNNFLFGNDQLGYYETICGGSGATATSAGASGVHTHMTNTRITDPEVLEHRFPLRLRAFRLRKDSGGAGKNRGGDGVEREFEFLEPLAISCLMEHRVVAPYGSEGGAPGAVGEQIWIKADGTRIAVDGKCSFQAEAGDRLLIRTPGGGGWGKPE